MSHIVSTVPLGSFLQQSKVRVILSALKLLRSWALRLFTLYSSQMGPMPTRHSPAGVVALPSFTSPPAYRCTSHDLKWKRIMTHLASVANFGSIQAALFGDGSISLHIIIYTYTWEVKMKSLKVAGFIFCWQVNQNGIHILVFMTFLKSQKGLLKYGLLNGEY